MRLRLSQLAIAALFADASLAFLPANTKVQRTDDRFVVSYGTIERKLFTSTSVVSPMDGTASQGDNSNNEDSSILQAYDEWRAMYGRGDFDSARFENFKNNFEMLTKANIEARDNAIAEGKNPPVWMTLNEYGDFSIEEYEAEIQQSSQINGSTGGSTVTEDDYEEMERALEYVINVEDAQRESILQVINQECPDAYKVWCESSGKIQDPTRFEAFSVNYAAMRIFTERTGKVLELNEYADCTKEEYDGILRGSVVNGSVNGVNGSTSYEEEANPATSQRKTFFIKDSNPAVSKRKTLVIPEASANPSSARGTQVIQPAGQANTVTGTQVIQANTVGGTQVIQPAGQANTVRGTQVIQANTARGTQVIQPAGQANTARGTQVIQTNTARGTQVIQPVGGANTASNPGNRGTQVIRHAGVPPAVRGTRVISGTGDISQGGVRGTQVIRPATPVKDSAPRGTCVVNEADKTRRTPAFSGTQVISQAGAAVRGTQVIQSVRGTRVVQQAGEQPTNDGGSINRETRGTMVIKSNDPASTSVNVENQRSVRGTIVLQRKSREIQPGGRRETLIVNKSELDGALPSLFSFIGGADSTNSNSRGTVVIKKNKNIYQAEKEKKKKQQLDAITEAVEVRRLDALRRRDAQIQGSLQNTNTETKVPELGPTGLPGDLPIVRDWTQHADGSITGLIYRSANYKDGTQITTSPVPEGAKAGYLVKTEAGTKYLLR